MDSTNESWLDTLLVAFFFLDDRVLEVGSIEQTWWMHEEWDDWIIVSEDLENEKRIRGSYRSRTCRRWCRHRTGWGLGTTLTCQNKCTLISWSRRITGKKSGQQTLHT